MRDEAGRKLFEDAVREFKRVAAENGVPELLVGAYAREFLLQGLRNRTDMRQTRDVDFGVRVDSWDSFDQFKRALMDSGSFQRFGENGHPHKLLFDGRMEVDFIPFGKLAADDGKLACWPDEFGQEMNVTGYDEALERSDVVRIGDSEIRVVSLEAFVVLKILAWNDRPMQRQKDAIDVAHLLRNFGDLPGVADELFAPANRDLVEMLDDFERQCHRWLGRRIASVFGARSREMLFGVLERETSGSEFLLSSQMHPHYRNIEDAVQVLSDLKDGLMDPC